MMGRMQTTSPLTSVLLFYRRNLHARFRLTNLVRGVVLLAALWPLWHVFGRDGDPSISNARATLLLLATFALGGGGAVSLLLTLTGTLVQPSEERVVDVTERAAEAGVSTATGIGSNAALVGASNDLLSLANDGNTDPAADSLLVGSTLAAAGGLVWFLLLSIDGVVDALHAIADVPRDPTGGLGVVALMVPPTIFAATKMIRARRRTHD